MNNTDKVVQFLKEAKVFYIATVDGDQARVRPFGIAVNIEGKLSICTGSSKKVAHQIKDNPNVEISAMTSDGKYIRITGKLYDNTNPENKKKFFEIAPQLSQIYKGKEDDFAIFSFSKAAAIITDAAWKSETIELD